MSRKWLLPAVSFLMLMGKASAQERPLSVGGTFTSGYYNSYTRGGNGSRSIRFMPAGAAFDLNGYFLSPDLVSYYLQPKLYAGSQAGDAGFQGGDGLQLRIALLRRRAFPLTFRYANTQSSDAYFGNLSQVSSYMQKNHNKDLGLSWEFKRRGMPTAAIDWGTNSITSQSGIGTIPDNVAQSSHVNLDSTYQIRGWDLHSSVRRQQQTSDLFVPLGTSADTAYLRQKVEQYEGSARRTFLSDSELYLDSGSQSTANLILHQPIDLTTRFASVNFRIMQRRKWKTSLRAAYTSNVAGLLLTQLVGGLGTNGSIAPDSSALQPFRHSISYMNLSSRTSVDLPRGFGLFGSIDRTSVLTSTGSALSSRYFNTAGGVTYARSFSWGSLSGQYGRTFGIGSVTGQSGTIEGQNYVVTVQCGKQDRLRFDFSLHGSDQGVSNEHAAGERSISPNGNVETKLFGSLRARFGGGWQQSTFSSAGNDFHTSGYTAQAGIEHPRFQFSGSMNSSVGDNLQTLGQSYGNIGVGSAILAPLRPIPSDLRGTTFSLRANPMRKVEISALWTNSIQHLQGVVANNIEIVDVHVTYHLRRLDFVGGLFHSAQAYASYLATYPQMQQGRLYIRISRTVKFL